MSHIYILYGNKLLPNDRGYHHEVQLGYFSSLKKAEDAKKVFSEHCTRIPNGEGKEELMIIYDDLTIKAIEIVPLEREKTSSSWTSIPSFSLWIIITCVSVILLTSSVNKSQ